MKTNKITHTHVLNFNRNMDSKTILINETLVVKEIDMVPTKINNVLTKIKNKIFSKVSRISASSYSDEIQLLIDINTEIYEIQEGDRLEFYIVHSIFPNDSLESENAPSFTSIDDVFSSFSNIIDSYEYVMYGTIYHSGVSGKKFFIYGSFGGLLLKIFGNNESILKKVDLIKIDSKILLCIRKK